MPRTLAGDAQTDIGPCDPRCKLENHVGQQVSNRVRRRCAERLNDAERRQANTRQAESLGSSATEPGPSKPTAPVFNFSGYVLQTLTSIAQPQPELDNDSQDMDTTMPTWGLPGAEIGDTRGNPSVGLEVGDEDMELDNNTDGASDADSESSYIEQQVYLSSLAAYDYASGSNSDSEPETDAEPSFLDGLHSISPNSSQECLPEPELLALPLDSSNSRPPTPTDSQENVNLQGDTRENVETETTTPSQPPSNLGNGLPNAPPVASPEPEAPGPLPDALRALREWILSHISTGDLTVDAANSLLKTLDFCLEKDLLRCGAEQNSEHRLPLTLETLQRHARTQANMVEIFAVCPDFSCQTLRKLASMSPDRPYICEKCGKEITRRKITRRRARKPLYHYAPILRYTYCPIVEQLKAILSRPGIWKAIDEHRQHLKREGKAPGTLEDIQHGKVWVNLTKDGQPFFGDTNNIGFILMCDWFQPNSRQGAPSYSTGVISLCIANLPPHLRVRPENKIIVGATPGPHEPNVDTINNFLEPMVHELLSLWDRSTTIDNPDDGIARDVCAALVACACDSPAARKVGGFPGTGGTYCKDRVTSGHGSEVAEP